MRLSVEEMTVWAKDFYARAGHPFRKNVNWTQVGRDAGWSSSLLGVQRKRNEMDARTIIRVARTYDANPLDELARIPRWNHLATRTYAPSEREILASVHPRHVFHELGDRLGENPERQIELEPWDSYYARFSTWFDVAGGRRAKERLAKALQISNPSSMSARLNGRIAFEVDDILDTFVSADMDRTYALVLAGWITDTEAGYAPNLRVQTLTGVHVDELIYVMHKQMRFVLRLFAPQRAGEHPAPPLE